ncbi:hypothetical protein [Methylobacterium symbioticum]|uniref:hypothetical protein n=1 Tax=Methylobacterium symbioticum TaxID=2584084 RepID=UPI0027B9B5E7|nr:hypothetical protein [Methylobacterium symbioticum]
MTGWWAAAARALALVLALAVAAPVAGFAEDAAFHGGGSNNGIELAMTSDPAAGGASAFDPGLACHAHCGCHVVAKLDAMDLTTLPEASRPSYARMSETASSVFPNRLPRPPRA